MDNQIWIAYAAGLFDGEGCITIVKASPSGGHASPQYTLRTHIAMQNEMIMRWYSQQFNMSFSTNYRKPRLHPIYECYAASNKAAEFLKIIQPYLCVKKEQLTLALEFQATMSATKRTGRTPTTLEELERRHKFYLRMRQLNGSLLEELDSSSTLAADCLASEDV